MKNRNIVVIGGSAGGFGVVSSVLAKLPTDFPAAVFLVLHVDPNSENWLPERLRTLTQLQVVAVEECAIEPGRVYVAPPDRHLIVTESSVKISRGPRENLWRPAIDVLFRSAAVNHRSRVIGVLLSGQLDDGTAGLQAIRRCGGITCIQDPKDAAFSEMPRSALTNAVIDHCVTAVELPALLALLTNEFAGSEPTVPQSLKDEVAIAAGEPDRGRAHEGTLTHFSCPECSGPLWRRGDDSLQFRCLVGHSYHADSLLQGADMELDRTLWAAIRLFEQRANISRTMAEQEHSHSRQRRAELHERYAAEAQRYADTLRELQLHRRQWTRFAEVGDIPKAS